MRRVRTDEDMVFPAVRDAIKKKRFRERHRAMFNALVAFVTSLLVNILLSCLGR